MKRYMIFAFDKRKKAGGFDDFVSDHDTLIEAQKAARKIKKEVRQIIDLHEERLVELQNKEK